MSLFGWLWGKGKKAEPPPQHSSNGLRQLTAMVESKDLAEVSLKYRCLAAHNLRDMILSTARRDGQMMPAPGGEGEVINPALFQREIAALNKLLATMQYSPALNDWLNARRHEFVAFLHERLPPGQLTKEWRKQNLLQRVETVSRIMKEQCRLYSEGAIDFFPSRIIPFKAEEGMLGYTLSDPAYLRDGTIPAIYIKRSALEKDTPFSALETAHHEQIHVFLMQMAIAAAQKRLDPDHPLYHDAHIKLSRVFRNAVMPAELPNYWRDPEEIVCHTQDNLFIDEYRHPPLWRRLTGMFSAPTPL